MLGSAAAPLRSRSPLIAARSAPSRLAAAQLRLAARRRLVFIALPAALALGVDTALQTAEAHRHASLTQAGCDCGSGSFGAAALWENIRSVPTHENIPGWWVFNSLMVALIVMHVIWYLMFWRMLFRLIGGETGHEAGKEEYEGDSDDE